MRLCANVSTPWHCPHIRSTTGLPSASGRPTSAAGPVEAPGASPAERLPARAPPTKTRSGCRRCWPKYRRRCAGGQGRRRRSRRTVFRPCRDSHRRRIAAGVQATGPQFLAGPGIECTEVRIVRRCDEDDSSGCGDRASHVRRTGILHALTFEFIEVAERDFPRDVAGSRIDGRQLAPRRLLAWVTDRGRESGRIRPRCDMAWARRRRTVSMWPMAPMLLVLTKT